jgi:hypothetical protein
MWFIVLNITCTGKRSCEWLNLTELVTGVEKCRQISVGKCGNKRVWEIKIFMDEEKVGEH